MDFIGRNMFRIAGALIAAQVFLTFCLIGQSFLGNMFEAFKLMLLPLPVLGLAVFLSPDNGMREAGYTAMLWSGAGAVAFFGALYGDPTDQLPYVDVPQISQVGYVLGFGNLALAFVGGFAMWMYGVLKEPPPPEFHTLPGASF